MKTFRHAIATVTIAFSILFNKQAQALSDDLTGGGGAVGGCYGAAFQAGATGCYLGAYSVPGFLKPGAGLIADIGVLGRSPKGAEINGVFSVNHISTFNTRRGHFDYGKRAILPFATFGYTRFIPDGNGMNYGGGILWRYRPASDSDFKGIRFEYREYYLHGSPTPRVPTIRISWETGNNNLQP